MLIIFLTKHLFFYPKLYQNKYSLFFDLESKIIRLQRNNGKIDAVKHFQKLIYLYKYVGRSADAIELYNQMLDVDKSFEIIFDILIIYSKKGDIDNSLNLFMLKKDILTSKDLNLHWNGVLGSAHLYMIPQGSRKLGVPLVFAELLVEHHMNRRISAITGYRGGTVLQNGLIDYSQRRGYTCTTSHSERGKLERDRNYYFISGGIGNSCSFAYTFCCILLLRICMMLLPWEKSWEREPFILLRKASFFKTTAHPW